MTRRPARLAAGCMFALVLAVAASAGAAHAAAGQTFHYKLRGQSAQAIWQNGRAVTFVDGEFDSIEGGSVFVDRFTATFDHGHFTGGTDLSGFAFVSGVTVTVTKHLTSAAVIAKVPVRRCKVKAGGKTGACVDAGTISVRLSFTGVGPVAHGGSNDRFHYPGVTVIDHLVGTQRDATVKGRIAGVRMRSRDLQDAVIGHMKGGGVTVCHGC